MAKTKKPQPPPRAVPPPVFTNLPYHVWRIVPDDDDDSPADGGRPYIDLTAPYGLIRDWLYAESYDSLEETGWQRDVSTAHVKAIAKDMEADRFTPTGWTASADEWHVANLNWHAKEDGFQQVVDLKVTRDHKLRLTDGNHRRMSLESLLEKAIASGDVDRRRLIERTPIGIKVLLSPEHIYSDFIHLQKGKSVPLNLIKSLEIREGRMSPEKLTRMKFATEAARLLDADSRSHLFRNVAFDTKKKVALPVDYSSLVADHASSLATTLYGGAMIAIRNGKDPAWMIERYVDAYETLAEYKDDDGESILYAVEKKLSPKKLGGSKGGTHLLLGVGHALAWRLIHLDKADGPLDAEEADHLLEKGCRVFEHGKSGGSATDKRADMNRFCRAYFKDLATDLVDGVPVDLILATTASSWGVLARNWKEWVKKHPDRIEPEDAASDPELEAEESEEESS